MTSGLPTRPSDFAELAQFQVHPASVRLLSQSFCQKRHVVVLGVVSETDTHATVGMLHPGDHALRELVEQVLGRQVRGVRLNDFEIQKAIAIGFGKNPDGGKGGEREPIVPVGDLSFAPNQSAPDIVNALLGHAVLVGASDIHVECYEGDVDVRLRIDGELHQLGTPISRANIDEITARLKILADLNIAERREAQDGRIMASYAAPDGTRPIDFRTSIVPGPFGEDTVMRILDSKPLTGLDKLGFAPDTLAELRALTQNPEGLIFVTGPTGSGKTTTLYSALAEINTPSNKLLTVEDPIEYHFPKANQKQVSAKMGFADYARAFMRQDPDIMLIGEIRDEETASIAVRAAQTGHLVLTTLHTNSSIGTVPRMTVLGIDQGLIADTMLGSLSQRLVRRVCSACTEPKAASPFELDIMEKLGRELALVHGRGCDACRGTGYRGRVGLYELFVVDDVIADAISRGATALELRRAARAKGMRSL
ncbi:MAG: type II/IV secretion system protein, partial [Myxococcales bacterium]|nr:type II/IV secretion system protein [Myxococcales bacterium]